MKYIAVVVTYNRKNYLKVALDKLLAQTTLPYKIVLVDNHSTDGTKDFIKAYLQNGQAKQLIDYLELPENVGGAGGFYAGIKEALTYQSDFIAVSDDDAWYSVTYFTDIFNAYEQNKNILAFQGLSKDIKTGKISMQNSNIANWNTLSHSSSLDTNDMYDTGSFCGMVISTDLINKIGLPRKDFFIWGDDKEYSLRMHAYTKIKCVRNAILQHNNSVKRGMHGLVPVWKAYYGFRNNIVLRQMYSHNKLIANLYNIYLLLRNSSAVLLKSSYKGQKKCYLSVYIDGFFDAYFHHMGRNNKFLPGH